MNTKLAILLLCCTAITSSAVDIKHFNSLNDRLSKGFTFTLRVSKVSSDFTFDVSVPNDLIYNEEGWSKPLSGIAVIEITPEQKKSCSWPLEAAKRQPVKTEKTKLGTTAMNIVIAEDRFDNSYLEVVYMPPEGGVCPILLYVSMSDVKSKLTTPKQ